MTTRIEKLLGFYFASKLRKGQVVTFTEVKRCCEEFGANASATIPPKPTASPQKAGGTC